MTISMATRKLFHEVHEWFATVFLVYKKTVLITINKSLECALMKCETELVSQLYMFHDTFSLSQNDQPKLICWLIWEMNINIREKCCTGGPFLPIVPNLTYHTYKGILYIFNWVSKIPTSSVRNYNPKL